MRQSRPTGTMAFVLALVALTPSMSQARAVDTTASFHRAVELERAGNVKAASETVKAALHESPLDDKLLKLMMALCAEQQKFSEAVAAGELALQVKPDDVEIIYNLARVYQDWRNYPRAVSEYKKVLASRANHVNARLGMAQCLLSDGQIKKAVQELRKLTKASPTSYQAWMTLCLASMAQDDLDQARMAAEAALQLCPDDLNARRTLAEIDLNQMRGDRARELAQSLLESHAQCIDLYLLVMRSNEQGFDDLLLGQELFAKAKQKQGRNVVLFRVVGRRFERQGDNRGIDNPFGSEEKQKVWWQLAERCYRQALAVEPRVAEHHMQLAILLDKQGNLAEAIREIRSARALSPDSKPIARTFARLKAKENDLAGRIKSAVQKALKPVFLNMRAVSAAPLDQ